MLASTRRFVRRCIEVSNFCVSINWPLLFRDWRWSPSIEESRRPPKTNVKPVILDGLGYGQNETASRPRKIDLAQLLPADIRVVEQGAEREYRPLLNNQHLSELTAAVVPPNIELISSLLVANVPTLCLYNEHTQLKPWQCFEGIAHANPCCSVGNTMRINFG